MKKNNIYTVGQINAYIRNMFAQDFLLKSISIRGEVSNCKYHTSGHIYFTLKDAGSAIPAVMFAGNAKGMTFRMKEGDSVVVTGSVEVYERDGRYQLYARRIEREGAGDLFVRFEALKQELSEMGMFAQEYKLPIPKYARRIGVVTSSTGAAVRDIQNISARRNPYVQLILYPAQVQGEGAVPSIIGGLHAMERLGVDVIIVGRGGGSIEDLWAFNEEAVARAIFDCPIPVISAVGHETDTTIADFVADLRAPTPSAAAELAVYDYWQTKQQLDRAEEQLGRSLRQKLSGERRRLEILRTRLRAASPESRLHERQLRLADLAEELSERMAKLIERKRHRLQLLSGVLDGLSPAKKLGMGYAHVADASGRSLIRIGQVKPGDEIEVHVTDGTIRACVRETQKQGESYG